MKSLLQIAVRCPQSGEKLLWNSPRRAFLPEAEEVPTPFPSGVSAAREIGLHVPDDADAFVEPYLP